MIFRFGFYFSGWWKWSKLVLSSSAGSNLTEHGGAFLDTARPCWEVSQQWHPPHTSSINYIKQFFLIHLMLTSITPIPLKQLLLNQVRQHQNSAVHECTCTEPKMSLRPVSSDSFLTTVKVFHKGIQEGALQVCPAAVKNYLQSTNFPVESHMKLILASIAVNGFTPIPLTGYCWQHEATTAPNSTQGEPRQLQQRKSEVRMEPKSLPPAGEL